MTYENYKLMKQQHVLWIAMVLATPGLYWNQYTGSSCARTNQTAG